MDHRYSPKTPGPCASLLSLVSVLILASLSLASDESPAPKITWLGSYGRAMDEGKLNGKMVLAWFYDPAWKAEDEKFAEAVFSKQEIAKKIAQDFVSVKLPVDAMCLVSGQEIKLLAHGAFAELLNKPGIAIIDQTNQDSPYFGRVVSVFPFAGKYITARQLGEMLNLPKGSLTQRTLIWAVRTHPEEPASARGEVFPVLAEETEKHAFHQASITLQGHHNWETRFHSINARLPAGLLSQEVCAESWPGQNLVEAAEECVHSWRQSSGHWDAVRRQHAYFSYDMQKGRNGVWYATGIFAKKP